MHSKNIFRYLLLCISILFYSNHCIAGAFPGMPGQGPSVDDIKAMEQEIDNFVRSLPPEQQKQFYKDVEELTGIMEKMSPDELNEFVGSVFSDAGLTEPTPPPAKPTPTPTAVPKEEAKPAVVITTAPSGPTEKALNMINSIIKRTEEFMRKAQIIPELQVKMNKWVVQKKLLEVTAALDWETVEVQIDELNVLLYSLREIDHKTGQYKHIGNLIKDEALYNNLATLQVTLEAYVPLIYAPDFGLEAVSKESRAAIREVLSQYLESFYLLNIPAAIKKVKLLYEPRAKELTEEEKKAAEQARKEAEKTRMAAPATKSSGTRAPYTSTPYNPPSSYDRGSSDYGYTPSSYGSYDYGTPSVPSGRAPSAAGGAGAKPGTTAKAEGKGGKAGGGEKEGAGAEETGEAPGATTKGGKTAAKEEIKEDPNILRKLSRITKIEDDIEKLKDKSFGDTFKKFKDDFLNGDLSNTDTTIEARAKALENTNTSLKKAIDDIKKFKKDDLGKLNKTEQDHYKKELSSSLKDVVKFYKALRDDVATIQQVASYPSEVAKFGKNKYYLYFGKGSPSADVKNKIDALYPKDRITMEQLDKTIQDFLKEAAGQ